MTAVDLDALDAARAAATAGPWRVDAKGWIDAGDYDTVIGPADVDCMAYCYGGTSRIEGDNLAADAALIVAAVNALPALLAEARKYRELREAVEGLAEEFRQRQHRDEYAVDSARNDEDRVFYVGRAWGNEIAAKKLTAALAAVDGGDGA